MIELSTFQPNFGFWEKWMIWLRSQGISAIRELFLLRLCAGTTYCSSSVVLRHPSLTGSGDGVGDAGALDMANGVGKGLGDILVIVSCFTVQVNDTVRTSCRRN